MSKLMVFSGNAHPQLAKEIAKELAIRLGDADVSKFSDGEISVEINEKIYADFLDMPIEFTYTDFNDLPKLNAEKIIIGGVDLKFEAEIKKLIPDYLYTEQAGNRFIIIINQILAPFIIINFLHRRNQVKRFRIEHFNGLTIAFIFPVNKI